MNIFYYTLSNVSKNTYSAINVLIASSEELLWTVTRSLYCALPLPEHHNFLSRPKMKVNGHLHISRESQVVVG
jgi:hypothetical protein